MSMSQIEKKVNVPSTADSRDGNALSEILRKTLDVNKYATKKTIAQGLLDIALLTANAAQLKYILEVGESHEFYIFMLVLISVSIALQVVQACICVILGGALDINKEHQQDHANRANNIIMCINIIIMAVNVLINSFEMKNGNNTGGGSTVTVFTPTTVPSSGK